MIYNLNFLNKSHFEIKIKTFELSDAASEKARGNRRIARQPSKCEVGPKKGGRSKGFPIFFPLISNFPQKIIEAMTRGKDVSMLFTDVVKNMATTDMELKKLIYLYIINYAKSHADLAILAINTFRKVTKKKDSNKINFSRFPRTPKIKWTPSSELWQCGPWDASESNK